MPVLTAQKIAAQEWLQKGNGWVACTRVRGTHNSSIPFLRRVESRSVIDSAFCWNLNRNDQTLEKMKIRFRNRFQSRNQNTSRRILVFRSRDHQRPESSPREVHTTTPRLALQVQDNYSASGDQEPRSSLHSPLAYKSPTILVS